MPFARRVLAYGGHDGWRWSQGAARAARIAILKARLARGASREGDLSYHLDLALRN